MGEQPGVDWGPCPDCSVAEGEPHQEGCDVARCKDCGRQELGCDHHAPMTIWRGHWPGDAEVGVGLAKDLNELQLKGLRGELVWDQVKECWRRPVVTP